jgi:hypothetical protein
MLCTCSITVPSVSKLPLAVGVAVAVPVWAETLTGEVRSKATAPTIRTKTIRTLKTTYLFFIAYTSFQEDFLSSVNIKTF